MIVSTVLVMFMATAVKGQIKIEAFSCDKPSEVRMLAHENCAVHSGHSQAEEFTIIQSNPRRNITGYKCEIMESTIINYCGHYSSTKATGESRYHVAKKVSNEKCREMASKGTYEAGGVIHTVRMNAMNHIAWFTHGSVQFSGTNIACVQT